MEEARRDSNSSWPPYRQHCNMHTLRDPWLVLWHPVYHTPFLLLWKSLFSFLQISFFLFLFFFKSHPYSPPKIGPHAHRPTWKFVWSRGGNSPFKGNLGTPILSSVPLASSVQFPLNLISIYKFLLCIWPWVRKQRRCDWPCNANLKFLRVWMGNWIVGGA